MAAKYGWRIDRDYLFDKEAFARGEGVKSRVGVQSQMWKTIMDAFDNDVAASFQYEIKRWRCKDDDGNVYYGGELVDNGYCDAQEEALAFCMQDAGCTSIEVKSYGGDWVQEIG